ncbi:hypothetical protein SEUCBS139899_006934 [Sporothrix eucalyptigena]|uniref:Alpha-1,3-mannosyltransferase CMT1 n=1 Tax=Sporothrix eucalyptigena TaxID=1812306 RepID=A0ABP0CD51_9PEZI
MRRKYLFVGQVSLLLLVITALYFGSHHISSLPSQIHFPDISRPDSASSSKDSNDASYTSSGILSAENITRYVNAISDPKSEDLPRLKCPDIASSSRYDGLKLPSSSPPAEIKYFFAIDLRDSVKLLPRLLGSVVESIRFLGPTNCALSIIEGNSNDGTYDVLQALRPSLDALTTTYYLRSSDIDPKQGDRIAKLAELRNMALQPLLDNAHLYSTETTVVFLNDVAACTEDILELVYQRQQLDADMTCGMDWVYVGRDPTFYDVWVARGMNGDSFFEIPADGNWNSAWNLFWNNEPAQSSMNAHRPFQVFSCWNGAAVFTAKPIVEKVITFRGPREGECKQGEPQLFCKDMWFYGYGKIAVVPSVHLEYSDDRAQQIKDLKGYTSRWTAAEDVPTDDKIEWQRDPPAEVKCIPSYDAQSFRPWNETL